jgi:uncharacterized protein with FMN-binding domain
MRRTPIVVTATVAGLAGVLAFHTTPARLDLSSPAAPLEPTQNPAPDPTASQPDSAASTKPAGTNSGGTKPASTKPAGTSSGGTSSGGTRTADGPVVNYHFGNLSVSVTVSGSKITRVGIASLDDFGDARSEQIDQQSIPILEQEAVQAQSADIQGVSGASYTSQGFEQSLQGALRTLGV